MTAAADSSVAPRHVLAIAGSLRRGSWNRRVLHAAAGLAPPSLRITMYDDLAAIPMFNEDLEAPPPPVVEALRARVAGADGLLIATPEYNRSIPGVLKNAIDWLSRSDVLTGKPVGVLGATPGPWGTRLAQAELSRVLAATEAVVMPAPAIFLRGAAQLFDADGRLIDGDVRDRLTAFGAALARWIEGVSHCFPHVDSSPTTTTPPTRGLAPWQVKKITDYLTERLADEVGLDELAALVGLSRFHMCTAFRRATGQAPHQWLVMRRMTEAKTLLHDVTLSITDIGLAIGYKSTSAFSAAFRKATGVTPLQFRSQR